MAEKRHQQVCVGPQGRIVIPVQARRELGIKDGDTLILRADDGRLFMEKPEQVLERLQNRLSESLPRDISLVDELLAERREEARREEEEFLRHEVGGRQWSLDGSAN